MFHRIAVKNPRSTIPGHYVAPDLFRQQMRFLHRRGYVSVPPGEMFAPSPGRKVVITFDDGYRNFSTSALPILTDLGFTATVFLVSNLLGKTNEWDERNGDVTEALMTESEVLAAQALGIEFCSHTLDHTDLNAVDSEEARRQLGVSRRDLSRLLGRDVLSFCYPYGHKSEALESLVRDAGYQYACSTEKGLNTEKTSRFALRRINIRSDTVMPVFLYKMFREARRG
jgi:peptidoglycan/xylan/chitin deacetylase (PgdA/CDA1 family)